ncbi:hypothetical protein CEXT_711511 [Caerostris extrusa]|uniref:Uncharacterized protein n=1 Tax=Caerostris extrusa TaxID=172846 RepID=A0AAV4N386_CAEEX|nr:hypothetical protein CEXT_711511 [Caerostris extrusa]
MRSVSPARAPHTHKLCFLPSLVKNPTVEIPTTPTPTTREGCACWLSNLTRKKLHSLEFGRMRRLFCLCLSQTEAVGN